MSLGSKRNGIQGGPEKLLFKQTDSFVFNSNFCEPPCIAWVLQVFNINSNYRSIANVLNRITFELRDPNKIIL